MIRESFDFNNFILLAQEKEFVPLILYCKEKTKFLGKGSSRAAFLLPDDKVLKIAYNEMGIIQNKEEINILKNAKNLDIVPEIYQYDNTDNIWLIAEYVPDKIKSISEFCKLLGISRKEYDQCRYDYESPNSNNKYFNEIKYLIKYYSLIPTDIFDLSSWGVTSKGFPKLLDLGYTESSDYQMKDMF